MSVDERFALKIKLKSLAAEASIIRHAELKQALPSHQKVWGVGSEGSDASLEDYKAHRLERRKRRADMRAQEWYSQSVALRDKLYRHRIDVVRPEARATHLAYGYLRGTPYSWMEHNAFLTPSEAQVLKSRVTEMVVKYGPRVSGTKVEVLDHVTAQVGNWFVAPAVDKPEKVKVIA